MKMGVASATPTILEVKEMTKAIVFAVASIAVLIFMVWCAIVGVRRKRWAMAGVSGTMAVIWPIAMWWLATYYYELDIITR